jgi:hypothetical protein
MLALLHLIVTRKGTPAVATTARYTQPNREQLKHKLNDLVLSS